MSSLPCEICAEVNIKAWSTGLCSHPICFRCSLRLRILFKSDDCPMCKRSSNWVFIASKIGTSFPLPLLNDLTNSILVDKYVLLDPNSENKIICENASVKNLCLDILSLKCTKPSCNTVLSKREEFPLHMEKAHGKFVCSLCFENQKLFLEEIPLFDNATSLRFHIRTPEEKKKSYLQKLSGHPECKFCHTRFYSNDEIFIHCRDSHETCFICISNEIRDQYYENYLALENHFKKLHFICTAESCLEKKFVVFSTIIDLKGHMANQHPELCKGHQRSQNRHILSVDFNGVSEKISQQLPSNLLSTTQEPFLLSSSSFPSLSTTNRTIQKRPVKQKEDKFPSLSGLKSTAIDSGFFSLKTVPKATIPTLKPTTTQVFTQKNVNTSKVEMLSETFPELPKKESTSFLPFLKPSISSDPPPGLQEQPSQSILSRKPPTGKLRILRLA